MFEKFITHYVSSRFEENFWLVLYEQRTRDKKAVCADGCTPIHSVKDVNIIESGMLSAASFPKRTGQPFSVLVPMSAKFPPVGRTTYRKNLRDIKGKFLNSGLVNPELFNL